MIYAVIDTNVIVSAFITKHQNASTSKVWEAVISRRIIPIYSEEIIAEYSEVLHRKKFDIPDELVRITIDRILKDGVRGERVLSNDFFPDAKDIVFYEVALSRDDAYLVTGNTKHFPKKPIVVTPTEMMEILERSR